MGMGMGMGGLCKSCMSMVLVWVVCCGVWVDDQKKYESVVVLGLADDEILQSPPPPPPPPPHDEQLLYENGTAAGGLLSFLAVGDWGRKGTFNQSMVARQMGVVGEKLRIDFVISTGDNFYNNGLKSAKDSAFVDSFTKVYTAKSLQKQWYSVLGNHDYRGDALAQLSSALRKIDRRWFCVRNYFLKAELAEFYFIDTNPFVNKYFENPKNRTYDWRGVLPRDKYISNLLKDLRKKLQKSSSRKWKIVVGHHTIRSIGHHGDTMELVHQLLPILEENSVDMYINGHDHCLEHITYTKSPIQFLTSGGGSKAWKGDIHATPGHNSNFYYDGQGFMSVQLTKQNAHMAFYDAYGKLLYQFELSKK